MTPRKTAAILAIALAGLVATLAPAQEAHDASLQTQGTELSLKEIEEAKIAYPEILSTDDWNFRGNEGRLIRTMHYRIYTTEKTPMLRERLARFAEHALPHYRTSLTPNKPLPRPQQRLDTYLMDNRPQWTEVTKLLTGERSEDMLKIARGGFAFKGIGVYYDLGLYDTLAIAAHEGWHQYTQRTFRSALPIWLEEGIAAYNEGHRWDRSTPVFTPWANLERYEQLVSAHDEDTLFTLEELFESSPQSHFDSADDALLTYYAQLWAFVHFLNEYDNGKYAASLRLLLRDVADGSVTEVLEQRLGPGAARRTLMSREGPALFFAYFEEDLETVNEQYMGFIGTITAPQTRAKIADGKSPLAP